MNDLGSLPPLRDIIAKYGLSARRRLGQHFLLDLNLTDRIAAAAGDLTASGVIEIGPGPGGLTRSLLAAGARHVVAVERDGRCVEALAELAAACPERLTVLHEDALSLDTTELCRRAGAPDRPCAIVANLPYNIATPLLIEWLRHVDKFSSLTLMFQKEVAQRLVAKPRSKTYGRLTVLVRWLCEASALFDVAPRAFVPPPKVTSTVVRLVPRARPLAEADFATFERVTAAAFGQRRKMLRASLRSLDVDAAALLNAAGVTPTARAEELEVEEFCALARVLAETSPRAGG